MDGSVPLAIQAAGVGHTVYCTLKSRRVVPFLTEATFVLLVGPEAATIGPSSTTGKNVHSQLQVSVCRFNPTGKSMASLVVNERSRKTTWLVGWIVRRPLSNLTNTNSLACSGTAL